MSHMFTYQGNVNQNYIGGSEDGRIELPSIFFVFPRIWNKTQAAWMQGKVAWKDKSGDNKQNTIRDQVKFRSIEL
jgi:hypothetical protein